MIRDCTLCRYRKTQSGSWPCNVCFLTEEESKWEAKENDVKV